MDVLEVESRERDGYRANIDIEMPVNVFLFSLQLLPFYLRDKGKSGEIKWHLGN